MTLIAALIVALTLIGIYAHHARARAREAAVEAGVRQSEYLGLIQAIGQIHDAIEAIDLSVDLSALAFTSETITLLNRHMDKIHQDMAVLTTRVETGPGKRTLRVP